MKQIFIALASIAIYLPSGNAQSHNMGATSNSLGDTISMSYEMPSIQILGSKPRLMESIPGSAIYLSSGYLENIQAINGNDILKKVPGLHVLNEEGMGLRANIGIRGLDPDRSSNVLILEDGIPVALNPYGEPQMYYSPSIDRMKAIEILKGSGQIIFGPQSVGGVINYITKDPPEDLDLYAKLQFGSGGFFSTLLSYGNHYGTTGARINYLHKSADNLGIIKFHLNDVSAKFKLKLGEYSTLGLKLGIYDELSNSTYLGLTQSLYESRLYDYKFLAPDDQLEIKRLSGSLIHNYRKTEETKVQTTIYGYTTTRNWQRQDFSYTQSEDAAYVWGTPGEEGSIYMLNSNGHRNRSFDVYGIESKIRHETMLFNTTNLITAGVRIHHESASEQRINGTKSDARSGLMKEDEDRFGTAFSAFALNQLKFADKFEIDLGFRSEYYEFKRNIARTNFRDTSIISSTEIFQIIPGLGLNYSVNNLTIFTGLHRGFAPPRVKDAISNSGQVYMLDPELSWNYELGLRTSLHPRLKLESAIFYMDFENQIIPVSESSGGTGSGLVNGGETTHYGIELSTHWAKELGKFDISLGQNLSYTKSIYSSDRFISVENETLNIKDNDLPYAPQWHYNADVNLNFKKQISISLNWQTTSKQYTDEINTLIPSSDGRNGVIDGFNLLDASVKYTWTDKGIKIYFNLKNVLDQRYISSRRPQGIRVGLPRHWSIGIEWQL